MKITQIIITIFIITIIGLIAGCSGLSSTQTPTTSQVATSESVAIAKRIWTSFAPGLDGSYHLYVELTPESSAIANKVYTVELYEKGNLRETSTVSWNQPELNVLKEQLVKFKATADESKAYLREYDLSNIFSIKIY